MLRARGLDVEFVPCALGRPIVSSRWHINLPEISKERWNRRNFRLVIHAQDFIHFFGNLCVELHWLEQQFDPDQHSKIIIVCWDHRLGDIYEGNIKIENIDSLADPDPDLIESWLRHLSYGQFTKREMQQGTCWKIING
jgi:hypothetical protein